MAIQENQKVVTSHYYENDDVVDDDEDERNGEMCLDISSPQDSEDFNGFFDDTLLEMTQSSTKPTPSKRVARKGHRTKSFMVNEDILLCKAWLNSSLDAGRDNEQKRKRYWSRIHDYFHQNKDFESDRSAKSLTLGWNIISSAVGRFTGCYSQIQLGKQSNKTELDKLNAAKELYYSLYQGLFKLEYCWNVLKDQPKWDVHTTAKKKFKTCKDSSPGGSSQPTSTSINPEEDGGQTQTSAATETPIVSRSAVKLRPRRGLRSRKSLNNTVHLTQPSHPDHGRSIQVEKDQAERVKQQQREEREKEQQREEREKEQQQEAQENEQREEKEQREEWRREEREKERERKEKEKERQREEREREDQIREEEIMKLDLRIMTPHQVKYWTKKQLDILQKHNLM